MHKATLVEGPNDLSFVYHGSVGSAPYALRQVCTLSGDFAVCTIVVQSSTATQTEFITRVEIQGGQSVTRSQSAPTSRSSSGGESSQRPSVSPVDTSSVGASTPSGSSPSGTLEPSEDSESSARSAKTRSSLNVAVFLSMYSVGYLCS